MLCGIRPILVCMGFTTIFGALVMKSLRVYRVFMKSAMKRVKVTLLTILKFLAIFYVGDIIIFIGWYAADFPEPTITTEEASEFRGTVDKISCSSSSFIFTALLIFWKTILLVLGLYLSFLIRNVSVDFQESPWIFGSVVVVLVGCVLVMPMSYLVQMRAVTYYVFLASTLLICTMLIMGLMLVPKLFRLKEVGTVSGSSKSVVSVRSRHSLLSSKSRSVLNVNNVGNATETRDGRKLQVKPAYNVETTTNNNSTHKLLNRTYGIWRRIHVSHRGAYTAGRARALEHYCQSTPLARVLAVCFLTPLPILCFVLAMELLPLNSPSEGWRTNSGWIVRYVFVFNLLSLSCLQQVSSFLSTLNVTLGQGLAIAWITVSCYFVVLLTIMAVWVFPIPFVFELTGGVFGAVFMGCVVMILGRQTIAKTPQARVLYNVSAVEAAMCFVYLVFSAVYHVLNGFQQLALILVLYVLKVFTRLSMANACCSSTDEEARIQSLARLPERV
ncbi:hypothetical protein JG687_00010546, partial [Phytophthora cactorum]